MHRGHTAFADHDDLLAVVLLLRNLDHPRQGALCVKERDPRIGTVSIQDCQAVNFGRNVKVEPYDAARSVVVGVGTVIVFGNDDRVALTFIAHVPIATGRVGGVKDHGVVFAVGAVPGPLGCNRKAFELRKHRVAGHGRFEAFVAVSRVRRVCCRADCDLEIVQPDDFVIGGHVRHETELDAGIGIIQSVAGV